MSAKFIKIDTNLVKFDEKGQKDVESPQIWDTVTNF